MLATLDLLQYLSDQKMPVPAAGVLESVRGVVGDDYLGRALAAARQGNPKAVDFLRGASYIVTPATAQRLEAKNLCVPEMRVLMAIALGEGPTFSVRLRDWVNKGDDEGAEDARYVRYTVASYLQKIREKAVASVAASRDSEAEIDNDPEGPLPAQIIEEGKEYLSEHIYGGKAAVCFNADQTRGGLYTIRIEAAEANAQRVYDWKGKVSIQLSSRELPLVLATLMLWVPKFEGKGHGANNEKWFTLERQGSKMFLSVCAKGKSPRGVPIMAGDGYALTVLIIRQMLKNSPFLTAEAMLAIVKKQADLAGSV